VARLEAPEFHIEPEAADWRGSSRSGRVLRDEEMLVLEGDVTLVHRAERGAIEVRTERLRYDRRARTITSDETVTITQAESRLRSGGLRIELDNNLLELTDGVQGELEPAVADGVGAADPGEPGNGG
jgi:LPS export ABC transporter protein LptC